MTAVTEEELRRCDGLHVALLSEDELRAFNAACVRGEAYRSYEGPAGGLGLAKVRFRPTHEAGQ